MKSELGIGRPRILFMRFNFYDCEWLLIFAIKNEVGFVAGGARYLIRDGGFVKAEASL